MDMKEKLLEIKSQIDALRLYANGTTGIDDARLGEAVRRLCDGYGSASEKDVILLIHDAYTKETAGYSIDTGVHPSDYQQWTMFVSFDTVYPDWRPSQLALFHMMYEANPWPGLTIDMSPVSDTVEKEGVVRAAIGSEQILIFGHNPANERNRLVVRCDNQVLTIFSDNYPNGYVFSTPFAVSQQSVSVVIGAIKTSNGSYSRFSEMSNIDVKMLSSASIDAVCTRYIMEG